MKFARFRAEGATSYGIVEGDRITKVTGSLFRNPTRTSKRYKISEVKLLPPVMPRQAWCPGLNFASHLHMSSTVAGHAALPKYPQPWHKGVNSLIGPGDFISIPAESKSGPHYEGELVAVIGKTCKRVSPEEARGSIFGYTCGNDVSEREWQKGDSSLWRAKGADTFCPIGPWIETKLASSGVDMVVRLNNREVQRANTREMIFDFGTIISYISQFATLRPGDIVFSGTTGDTSSMKPGDVVEVEIEGIGVLRNPVKAEA
jgi:2-keto-4-pentenoate hydratase/2-oxohepta-3-ene-1,7-dioic acid hydratase in catechol pathway